MIPMLMSKRFNGLAHEEESTGCCFCYIPQNTVPSEPYAPTKRPPRPATKKRNDLNTPAVILTRPSIVPDKSYGVQLSDDASSGNGVGGGPKKPKNEQEILNPNDIDISFIPIEGDTQTAVRNLADGQSGAGARGGQNTSAASKMGARIQNTFKPFRGKYSVTL